MERGALIGLGVDIDEAAGLLDDAVHRRQAEPGTGDGASLLTSIVAVPGEVKTEVFDIDLRMRGGKTMPVRLYHKLAFGADGQPGASRTLVISRARDEHSDPLAHRRKWTSGYVGEIG